ncbi:hypothetical protein BLNAU_19328 [Blattamonas nauphoetae]|uniref:Uncharacterized protein n=1 Tax=Blattamonas nauphoetae TaxID=2049346 RepID=A0ABQ9X252_9EUKA|nr:hypothetical protein BLNAU_19328 [Blattamonas nauphoetae]
MTLLLRTGLATRARANTNEDFIPRTSSSPQFHSSSLAQSSRYLVHATNPLSGDKQTKAPFTLAFDEKRAKQINTQPTLRRTQSVYTHSLTSTDSLRKMASTLAINQTRDVSSPLASDDGERSVSLVSLKLFHDRFKSKKSESIHAKSCFVHSIDEYQNFTSRLEMSKIRRDQSAQPLKLAQRKLHTLLSEKNTNSMQLLETSTIVMTRKAHFERLKLFKDFNLTRTTDSTTLGSHRPSSYQSVSNPASSPPTNPPFRFMITYFPMMPLHSPNGSSSPTSLQSAFVSSINLLSIFIESFQKAVSLPQSDGKASRSSNIVILTKAVQTTQRYQSIKTARMALLKRTFNTLYSFFPIDYLTPSFVQRIREAEGYIDNPAPSPSPSQSEDSSMPDIEEHVSRSYSANLTSSMPPSLDTKSRQANPHGKRDSNAHRRRTVDADDWNDDEDQLTTMLQAFSHLGLDDLDDDATSVFEIEPVMIPDIYHSDMFYVCGLTMPSFPSFNSKNILESWTDQLNDDETAEICSFYDLKSDPDAFLAEIRRSSSFPPGMPSPTVRLTAALGIVAILLRLMALYLFQPLPHQLYPAMSSSYLLVSRVSEFLNPYRTSTAFLMSNHLSVLSQPSIFSSRSSSFSLRTHLSTALDNISLTRTFSFALPDLNAKGSRSRQQKKPKQGKTPTLSLPTFRSPITRRSSQSQSAPVAPPSLSIFTAHSFAKMNVLETVPFSSINKAFWTGKTGRYLLPLFPLDPTLPNSIFLSGGEQLVVLALQYMTENVLEVISSYGQVNVRGFQLLELLHDIYNFFRFAPLENSKGT